MESEQEQLAAIVAPVVWNYAPITDLEFIEKFPSAARARMTKAAAYNFTSTGSNVFVHYATPILEERRKRLLASGLRKKKYRKNAGQLWQSVDQEERFYWKEVAKYLTQCMQDGVLSLKGCLIHAGRVNDKKTYVWHAEIAVAAYLELPVPVEKAEKEDKVAPNAARNFKETVSKFELLDVSDNADGGRSESNATVGDGFETASTVLLDTLPDPFIYDAKIMYGNFAHYDYASIRTTEGKHQTAMLRQLANLFDKTGKILFYYYIIPHLCKQSYPPTAGYTVTGQGAVVWMLLPGGEKQKWCSASADVKKRLGDGDLGALNVLELDKLDEEVLRLHELAAATLKSHGERKNGGMV